MAETNKEAQQIKVTKNNMVLGSTIQDNNKCKKHLYRWVCLSHAYPTN